MLQAWQAVCTANSWLLVAVNHSPFTLPHVESSCIGLCVKLRCSRAKAANCSLWTWVLAKIRISGSDPKAVCLGCVSMIHLSLASTLHQGRTINFNWILVIYITGNELNIRLSSVVYSKFACPGEVIPKEEEWPGRKKNFFWRVLSTSLPIPMFFLHEHMQNTLSDTFLGVLRMGKEILRETENSVLT